MSDITSSYNEIKIDGDNNKIYIGSKEKFEPMMEWMEKKVKLEVKGVGKRYAPNDEKYKVLNQNLDISNIFNFIDDTYLYKHILYISNNIIKIPLIKIDKKNLISLIMKIHNDINREKDILDKENKDLEEEEYIWSVDGVVGTCELSLSNDMRTKCNNKIKKNKVRLNLLTKLEQELLSLKILFYKKNILWIKGEALIGKTHLFCDVALNKISPPTYLNRSFPRLKVNPV